MGRNRTPTHLHLIRGTDRKNPGRLKDRRNEPVPTDGIGEPPDHLDDAHKSAWGEIVKLCPAGVLGNSDRIILELAVSLLCQFRADPDNFSSPNLRHLISALSRMGLTPSDRSRIHVPKGDGANPFDKFTS